MKKKKKKVRAVCMLYVVNIKHLLLEHSLLLK